MEKLISLLEGIIADGAFSGTDEAGADILSRLRYAQSLCRELEAETGERLCAELETALCNKSGAPEALCRLCCYCESISNIQ